MPPNALPESSDELFRLLVEQATDYAIFALDTAGRVATWSVGAQRLTGYGPEDMRGQGYEKLFPPEAVAAEEPRRLLREAVERGHVEEEGWRVRKDTTRFRADATLYALRGDDGGLIGYAEVTRDLTEQDGRKGEQRAVATEAAPRATDERARAAAVRQAREERAVRQILHTLAVAGGFEDALRTIARVALSITEADGAYIERVDEARRTLTVVAVAGSVYPPLDARIPYPASLAELAVESGRPEIVDDLSAVSRPTAIILGGTCGACAALAAALRSDEVVLGALILLRRPHAPRFTPEEAARVEILADMGALALRQLLVVEAAERHARTEEALRQAAGALASAVTIEEVLGQIAKGAVAALEADGAVVERLDPDSGMLHVAATAGSLHIPLGGTIPYAGSYAEYAMTRDEPVYLERLDRGELPIPPHWPESCAECSLLAIALRDAGAVVGAMLLLRAPGRARFSQDEVQRARAFADLGALAIRKLHLLAESERAREDLQRFTESRARLMRGFSHDVKNPLGAALGFIDLLASGDVGTPPAEQQRPALERSAVAIRTAISLIDDLVQLARAEMGRLEIELETADLRNAADEVVDAYAPAAERKRLRFTTDFPKMLPTMRTDPRRVRQIIGNLLSNAVKYTPEGGAVELIIRERASRRDGESPRKGPWIAVHVVDTGPGIAPKDQERIFTEFTRLAPHAAEGSGLGLAISRRLAHLLGGDLTVESEPGHGSNFTLWLPARAADAADSTGMPESG